MYLYPSLNFVTSKGCQRQREKQQEIKVRVRETALSSYHLEVVSPFLLLWWPLIFDKVSTFRDGEGRRR